MLKFENTPPTFKNFFLSYLNGSTQFFCIFHLMICKSNSVKKYPKFVRVIKMHLNGIIPFKTNVFVLVSILMKQSWKISRLSETFKYLSHYVSNAHSPNSNCIIMFIFNHYVSVGVSGNMIMQVLQRRELWELIDQMRRQKMLPLFLFRPLCFLLYSLSE